MRSLVSYLNDKTPQEQRLISETWQASVTERLDGGNAYQLAQEMESEFLQRRLIERLTPADLELLAVFLARPDYILDPARQPSPPSFDRAKLLRQYGLIYDDRAKRDPDDPPSPPPPKNRGGWDTSYNGRFRKGIEDDGLKPVWLLPRELGRPFARLVPERLSSQAGLTGGVPLSRQPLTALVARLEPEILELQAENWGVLTLVGQAEPPELAAELGRALLEKRPQERVRAALSEGSQTLFRQIVERGGRTTITALLAEYISYTSFDARPAPADRKPAGLGSFRERSEPRIRAAGDCRAAQHARTGPLAAPDRYAARQHHSWPGIRAGLGYFDLRQLPQPQCAGLDQ